MPDRDVALKTLLRVLLAVLASLPLGATRGSEPSGRSTPNIVSILCDDLGYGDVQCLNPQRGMIPTPHCDRVTAEGRVFTEAHSSASVCSPSRYSILTGRYGWRTRLQAHVLSGNAAPLIARWPRKVKAGSTCDHLVSLTDLMATCADLLGEKLPDDAGEDSISMLPALLGTAEKPAREAVVYHSIHGAFAIQRGRWKLAMCPDSGGWSVPRRRTPEARALPPVQLYDMLEDIGERANQSSTQPEVVAQLTALLENYVAEGRSTPGIRQKNDVDVAIVKAE